MIDIGSIPGMAVVTLGLALPFPASRSRPMFYSALTGPSGLVSVLLDGRMLYVTFV